MAVFPIGERLLVRPEKGGIKQTESGFLIEQKADYVISTRCEIVAIGGDCKKQWQVGHIVLAPKQAFTEAKEDPTDDTVVLHEDDIIAVILPDKAE